MNHQNGLPVGLNRPVITRDEVENAKINNQVVLSGEDVEFCGDDVIFFIEYIDLVAQAPISLFDKDGVEIVTFTPGVVASLNLLSCPLRVDGGVKFDGTLGMLKGFYMIKKIN